MLSCLTGRIRPEITSTPINDLLHGGRAMFSSQSKRSPVAASGTAVSARLVRRIFDNPGRGLAEVLALASGGRFRLFLSRLLGFALTFVFASHELSLLRLGLGCQVCMNSHSDFGTVLFGLLSVDGYCFGNGDGFCE